MRKCFVHIGTHKTGTKAIQVSLKGCRSELAKQGFLYPTAGIPSVHSGHHNIAWQLTGDRRFRAEHGTIDDLLDEIENSDHDVIISSEDLECAAHHQRNFQAFVGSLRQRGLDVIFVVYLRNQADYVRSLYVQLILLGYRGAFDAFVATVLEQQVVRWREWVFAFCYWNLLKLLPAEATIVARSYDRDRSVIGDFMSILGLNSGQLHIDDSLRANQQHPVSEAFFAFYRNQTGRPLDGYGPWVKSTIARIFDTAKVDMEAQTRNRLIAAFHESNLRVKSRYGISQIADMAIMNEAPTNDSDSDLYLEAIFSLTTVRLVSEFAGLAGAEREPAVEARDFPGRDAV